MMEKDMIVKLWAAQGFICSEGSQDMEEIGGLYFDDLLKRSLLQDAELDYYKNIVSCKMHDLVHDLAQSVAGSDYSLVEIGEQALPNLKKVRHSFINISDEAVDEADDEADEMASIWAIVHKAHKLRTLLIKSRMTWLVHSRISKVPHDLFHHFRRLRALDSSHSSIKKLPRTVGQLKHLRYLDLSWTDIEELPEMVTNCGNLQTLKLNVCLKLRKLPKGMSKMLSLRHLELEGTDALKYLLQGMGRLTGLRTLSHFLVGGGDEGCKCEELKHLNHLQGTLEISGLDNVKSKDEARDADLYKKQHLHALSFYYGYSHGEPLDDEVKRIEDVLEVLKPHTNLKEISIEYYKGSKLPKWIEDPVFSNLVKIKISDCQRCKQLPCLGKLPSLKYLRISGMKEVRKVGGEFSGDDNNKGSGGGVSFPKLETLFFSNMPNWEEWELRGGDGEIMPSLLELQIGDCPKLKELPSNILLLLQKLSLNIGNEGMSSGGALPILPNLKHLVVVGNHWYSYELTSLPCGWLGELKSLQTLKIDSCRWLGSLPEELQELTMLQELMIWDCPLLEERCRDGGEDWYKIAHIPRISIK